MSYRPCDYCGDQVETTEEIANEPARGSAGWSPFYCPKCRPLADPPLRHRDPVSDELDGIAHR